MCALVADLLALSTVHLDTFSSDRASLIEQEEFCAHMQHNCCNTCGTAVETDPNKLKNIPLKNSLSFCYYLDGGILWHLLKGVTIMKIF